MESPIRVVLRVTVKFVVYEGKFAWCFMNLTPRPTLGDQDSPISAMRLMQVFSAVNKATSHDVLMQRGLLQSIINTHR
jgi:hypothetical protein